MLDRSTFHSYMYMLMHGVGRWSQFRITNFSISNWYHLISGSLYTHLVVLLGGTLFKKAQSCVVSDRIGVKFGRNIFQANTDTDFRFGVTVSRWRPWRHSRTNLLPLGAWTQSVWQAPVADQCLGCDILRQRSDRLVITTLNNGHRRIHWQPNVHNSQHA